MKKKRREAYNICTTVSATTKQEPRQRTTEGEHLCSPHRSCIHVLISKKKKLYRNAMGKNFVIRKKVLIGKTASPLGAGGDVKCSFVCVHIYFYYHPLLFRYFLSCCRGGSLHYTSMGWLFKNRIYIAYLLNAPNDDRFRDTGKYLFYIDSKCIFFFRRTNNTLQAREPLLLWRRNFASTHA